MYEATVTKLRIGWRMFLEEKRLTDSGRSWSTSTGPYFAWTLAGAFRKAKRIVRRREAREEREAMRYKITDAELRDWLEDAAER